DFRQAELVDLLGGHVGGGVPLELVGVVRVAVGMGLAHAGRVHGGLGQFGLGEGDHALVGGLDVFQQRLARVFLQLRGALGGDLAVLRQRVGLGLGIGPQRAVLAVVERRAADDL